MSQFGTTCWLTVQAQVMEAGYGHSHHTGAAVSGPPISRPLFLSFPGTKGRGLWPEGSSQGGGISPGCRCRLCPLCRLARHTCAGCVECQVTTWRVWSVGIPRRPPRQGAVGVWRKVGGIPCPLRTSSVDRCIHKDPNHWWSVLGFSYSMQPWGTSGETWGVRGGAWECVGPPGSPCGG